MRANSMIVLHLRTHNPKVAGSNPAPATNPFNNLRSMLGLSLRARLRECCRSLRRCPLFAWFLIETINEGNVCARDQVSVGINRHLNRTVAHLPLVYTIDAPRWIFTTMHRTGRHVY